MAEKEGDGCFRARMIEFHNYKTLMGPCLISFSIPLLIPGVVLTVVGSYGNEHTFPTFGGWHISGIIILIIAVSLLITGIVFKCLFRPYLSPEIEKHLTPTNSINTGRRNLGFESEKDLEKAKRVYKGSEKDDLNTQINSQLHRVVSTHEVREKTSSAIEANGNVTQLEDDSRKTSNRHKQTNKVTHKDPMGHSDREGIDEDQEDTGEMKERRRKKHRSKKTITEETDGFTTTVTSTIQAEAETQVVPTSDQERNASSQEHSERKRRRRKKKKRHLERLEKHPSVSDDEKTTELPDIRIRTAQIPPNVPYQTENEKEANLNTPRPVEENKHLPVHFKTGTDNSDSHFNNDVLGEGVKRKRRKKRSHIKKHPARTDSDSVSSLSRDYPNSEKHLLGNNALQMNEETENVQIQNITDPNSVPKSRHAHFLRKRGISSDTQEPIDYSLHQPYTVLGTTYNGERSRDAHFRNATNLYGDHPRPTHLYSKTKLDTNLDIDDELHPALPYTMTELDTDSDGKPQPAQLKSQTKLDTVNPDKESHHKSILTEHKSHHLYEPHHVHFEKEVPKDSLSLHVNKDTYNFQDREEDHKLEPETYA